jgi:hypothetical protein
MGLARREAARGGGTADLGVGVMVVCILIHIIVSYDFMILPRPTNTYRDGILIGSILLISRYLSW